MDREDRKMTRLWRGVVVLMVAWWFVLGATPAAVAGEWRISFGSPHRYHSHDYGAGHHYEARRHYGAGHHYEAGRHHLPYYGRRRFYRLRHYGYRRPYRHRYYGYR